MKCRLFLGLLLHFLSVFCRHDGGVSRGPKPVMMCLSCSLDNAGANKKGVDGNMTKLDSETEAHAHKKVSATLAKDIQQARMAKGMSQAQLAQAINEKPAVVNQCVKNFHDLSDLHLAERLSY